jgi:hypothetical protein
MESLQILEREFLEMRSKLLELAASLDRIQRASGDARGADKLKLIRNGIHILASNDGDRAEQIQLLFSQNYDPDWRKPTR